MPRKLKRQTAATSKHSDTPWLVVDEHDGEGLKASVYSRLYAHGYAVTGWGSVVQTKANAERIVACVNAFDGVEDPAAFMRALRSDDLTTADRLLIAVLLKDRKLVRAPKKAILKGLDAAGYSSRVIKAFLKVR